MTMSSVASATDWAHERRGKVKTSLFSRPDLPSLQAVPLTHSSASDGGASPSTAPPTPSDIELVQRIAAEDADALSTLYDRYSGLLLAISRRILHDDSDAEDVLQEAFVQAWKQARRYDSRRSSVSTWLVLITRTRSIDRLRSRQVKDRTLHAVQQEKKSVHTSPEGSRAVLNAERRARLRQELDRLPAEQRQVLELAFYSGLTQSEIANETGTPLGTVKTRTLLAMKKLRKALHGDLETLL